MFPSVSIREEVALSSDEVDRRMSSDAAPKPSDAARPDGEEKILVSGRLGKSHAHMRTAVMEKTTYSRRWHFGRLKISAFRSVEHDCLRSRVSVHATSMTA